MGPTILVAMVTWTMSAKNLRTDVGLANTQKPITTTMTMSIHLLMKSWKIT